MNQPARRMVGADESKEGAVIGREIHLAARPHGEPKESDFSLAEVEVGEPDDGQVLVRNLFCSVDPYMRGRMNEARSYAPPYRVGEVMWGDAVGEVIASRSADVGVGDVVLHPYGWREYTIAEGRQVRRVDPELAPPSAYLGVLGMPGQTAYVGMLDIAGLKEGDVVFVSGAAGAVGSLAGQIAKLRGASRVIGSAGSDDKVAHVVDELGFDDAFNYRSAPVAKQLREAAPDGIDVYFDNVGGEHLEAAVGAMRIYGRAALCGAISQYNATEPAPGPRNLGLMVSWRLTLRGFIVRDHADRLPAFQEEVGRWLSEGRIRFRETVAYGIENMPDAFIGLLRGQNLGKMVVRLT